jgi:peptidoglycan/LPS O-acetylase OafA/YrhL
MPPVHAATPRVRRDLQGLRAIAVLAVVATHLTGWPRGGFVGVDVFFVLSGFLVTGILLRDLQSTGTVHLRRFFARRVRRLLPAALLVLAVVVGTGFLVFPGVRAEALLGDALAAGGLVSNWRFALEGRDYFSSVDVSPLQHFWSLSVEEQFSLAWPVIVLLAVALLPVLARRGSAGRAAVGAVAALVVVASGIVAWVQTPSDPSVAYFSTFTRAGELAVGAVLASLAPVLGRLPGVFRIASGWIGVGVVAAAFVLVDPAAPFPAPWAAMPVAGAALVIAGGIGGDPRNRPLFVLTNPLAVAVGDVSYSLYLWHLPVIVFAGTLLPPGPAVPAITVLILVVLTVATFLGVEEPLHRSPWLSRSDDPSRAPESRPPHPAPLAPKPRTSRPAPESARPTTPATTAVAARPSALASRPAGWVPGQRYYPGSRPVAAPPVDSTAPSRADATATAPREPAESPSPVATPALTASAPHLESRSNPQPVTPTPTPPPSPRLAWSDWRARFAPRISLAAASLVIGAGATVLAVFIAYGAPALSLAPAPVPVAAPDDGGDSLAALQADLAAATTASTWPELHPSMDDAMRESSAANRAHDCFTPDPLPDLGRCTWGSPDAPRHLYLIGDSSAMAYAPTFAKLADDSGGQWRVTTVGMYGCRFTDVLIESRDPAVAATCAQRKSDVAAMIAAAPADLLVVSNAFTLARTVDGRDLNAEELASAVSSEVGGWAPAGRTVYLSPPPHGADLGRCFSSVTGPGACLAAVDDVWTDMESALEARAATTGDAAISALPFTCVDRVCPAFAGSTPVRYDEIHITPAYAERLTPILRADLTARGLM